MINMILGAPGAGKSYEAVSHHVLMALRQGRKIITNLPLVMKEFYGLDPSYPALIELRHNDVEHYIVEVKFNMFKGRYDELTRKQKFVPFAHVNDFADPWRHPVHGFGPLYIIDECHKAFPRGDTQRDVEEWMAEHRHENADVLLITQSYGKVSKAITDLVQVCYRLRKATMLGSSNSYVRKVQDGLKGEVVNEGIRRYDPKLFVLYKSHTKSAYGSELEAQDVKPIWKNWSFIGAGLCLLTAPIIPFATGVVGSDDEKAPVSKVAQSSVNAQNTINTVPPAAGMLEVKPIQTGVTALEDWSPQIAKQIKGTHPYDGFQLHIIGRLQAANRDVYYFAVSQNGVKTHTITQQELLNSGYTILPMSDCSAKIEYPSVDPFFVNCNQPEIGPAGNPQNGSISFMPKMN